MSEVRKKGTGTWDFTQNRWELKRLGIRKTPKQLADILGEPVPEGKIASRPFWEKFLACVSRVGREAASFASARAAAVAGYHHRELGG